MAAEGGPGTPTDTQSVPTQLTSTPYDSASKPNVAEMFKRMGDKLGWFQYNDLETARKMLTSSSKKKSTKSRISKDIQHRREKKLFESDTSAEKLSFKSPPLQEKLPQNISNDEDFREPIPPHKSMACTDLTKEWKEKKKNVKKVTRISIIPSANAENVSPVFALHSDKRYSISNADAGNPIQESTRIDSRRSIEQLLGMSSESSRSSKDNTENEEARQNDTEDDSYKQLNILKNKKRSDSGDSGLTLAVSRIQITRSDQEDTQFYTTAQSEISENDHQYQTGMEKKTEILDGNPTDSMEASAEVQNILESSVESAKRTDSSSYIEMEDVSAQMDVSDRNHEQDSKSDFQNLTGAGSVSSPNGSLLKCSEKSGLDSFGEQIVKVTDVHPQEESDEVEKSDDSSYIEIRDVSLQTSAVLLSQKNSDTVTESDSSYVEVKERSLQTSFTDVSPKDNGQKSSESLRDQETCRTALTGINGGNWVESEPQNSSSVREDNTERAETSNRKESSGIVHHHIFSSDEESSGDDLINSRDKVVPKIPKIMNVRVKKEDEKSSEHKLTEVGKVNVEPNTGKLLDLDDSLPDIIQRPRLGEETGEMGAVCEGVKGSQYLDLSSDGDNDVKEVQEIGGDWVEGVLSSDSEDFLSDRGRSAKEKKKSHKSCQQQSSTDCWRTPKQYRSDSSDEEEELESFFHKIRAAKNFTPKDTPKKNRSLDEFIVEDDEMSSSDNDEEFYISTNSVLSTPLRKVEPIVLDDSDDDIFKFDIKPIQRKTKGRRQKPSSTNKKTVDVWNEEEKEKSFTHKTVDEWDEKEEEKYSFLKSLSTDAPADLCDREALRYSRNFKKMREDLTKRLFNIYNETVFDKQLPEDLPILWNNRLLKTAGYCVYKKNAKVHNSSSVRVELSTKVCDSAERVRDTLIHELCHAAVWILHGKNDGHGPYWRIWVKRANLSHPEIPIIARCHSYSITTKYTYQCSKCGYSIGRHSKSLDTSRKVCGFCHGEFLLINNKQTTQKDPRPGFTPTTPRTPNKFAMYVKENYGNVKGREKGLKHGDIMKLLGKEFADKNKISS